MAVTKWTARVKVVTAEPLGSPLAQAVTTGSPADDGSLTVQSVAHFEGNGGAAVMKGSSGTETIYYRTIDEATDKLLGVTRPNTKRAFDEGEFVQAGATEQSRKFLYCRIEDEDTTIPIPCPPELWGYFKKGMREDEDMEIVTIRESEDGEVYIADAPQGGPANLEFDYDAEIIAPSAIVPIVEANVQPIGLGDGATPDTPASAPVITQGPNMHLVDMRAYTKPTDWLAFVVEYSTNAGGSWTSLGDSGSNIFAHTNLSLGTAYRYRFSVKDSEGNTSAVSAATIDYTAVGVGTSDLVVGSVTATILASTITISNTFQTAASGSRVMFDGSGIRLINGSGVTVADLNASTGVATLTGAVFKTAASGSRVEADSNGLRFYDASGNIDLNLNASTGNISLLGSITSGSTIAGAAITGSTVDATSTITGATLQTATSGLRVRLGGGSAGNEQIEFLNGSTVVGQLVGSTGGLVLIGTAGTATIRGSSTQVGQAFGSLGFYGVTPTSRISMTDLSGGDSTTAQLHSKVNTLLGNLRTLGLLS